MAVNTLRRVRTASHPVIGMEQIVLVLRLIWTLAVCVENRLTVTVYHPEVLHGVILNIDVYAQVNM